MFDGSQLVSAAEFKAWLLSKPETGIVARHWDAHNCPIAKWLMSSGVQQPCVTPTGKILSDCVEIGSYPWVERFVNAVDGLGRRSVNRKTCLSILTENGC